MDAREFTGCGHRDFPGYGSGKGCGSGRDDVWLAEVWRAGSCTGWGIGLGSGCSSGDGSGIGDTCGVGRGWGDGSGSGEGCCAGSSVF